MRIPNVLQGVDWQGLPVGSKALSVGGGSWTKQQDGKWRCNLSGQCLSNPGGDIFLIVIKRDFLTKNVTIKKRRHRRFDIGQLG